MPRYIDADRLAKSVEDFPYGYRGMILQKIAEQPTSNAVEQKTGKWVEREVVEDGKAIEEWQSAKCSVCGKYHTTPYLYYFDDFNFCPNCGANMREVK